MRNGCHVTVIIPARNEGGSIGAVLEAIPAWVDSSIVVDNGSSDNTGQVAAANGAVVIHEPKPGYGSACLAGIAATKNSGTDEIIVFLDGDFSDDPTTMNLLVDPIIDDNADMVVSDRTASAESRLAMSFPQFHGNRLACFLMRLFWCHTYHDLGPFRAIRRAALDRLNMTDRNYGWTVEMQIRAVKANLKIREVPVPYRNRIAGQSKISGTFNGVLKAGSKILYVIFRERLRP